MHLDPLSKSTAYRRLGVRALVAAPLCAAALAGCAGGGLSTSSTCEDYNNASQSEQVRWIRKQFGPNQKANPGNLDSSQVAEGSEHMANHCGTDPDLSLGDDSIGYGSQLAP